MGRMNMNAIDRDDTAQKIAEIREALEFNGEWWGHVVEGEPICQDEIDEVNGLIEANRFLLSELDRIQQEYDEERAAHNAHVTELCEKEEECRKLRKELDLLQELAVKVTVEREKERKSAQQEIERLGNLARQERELADHWMRKHHDDVVKLREERDKLIEGLRWYAKLNPAYTGHRAREILKEIGVTVE